MSKADQEFVVKTITRREIAEELNEYTADMRSLIREFKEDDDRLTDEVCQKYARNVVDEEVAYNDDNEEDREIELDYLLQSMGYDEDAMNAAAS
jgi:hypothetical protein